MYTGDGETGVCGTWKAVVRDVDDLDGDHVDIDYTPGNYTPATTPAEAADVDDLAAHLYGIDVALGELEDSISLKAVTVSYTGSGSSGKTVTLTGINRAHWILSFNSSNNSVLVIAVPAGGTGTIKDRNLNASTTYTRTSLSAPAAGVSQVLTLNTTVGQWNTSGDLYYILVIGTST